MNAQVIVAFVFGITFVITLLALAIKFPHPSPFQYNVFRTVLSLAAAGIAAMVPGFIDLQVSATTSLLIRAGGALAVFVVVFFFNPAQLAIKDQNSSGDTDLKDIPATPAPPKTLQDGTPFPEDQRVVFFQVWKELVDLSRAGEALWENCSPETVKRFTGHLVKAQHDILVHGIFFSKNAYDSLSEILRAANFYLAGKSTLLEIRDRIEKLEKRGKPVSQVLTQQDRKQLEKNRAWLSKYQELLVEIRSSFHEEVGASVSNGIGRSH